MTCSRHAKLLILLSATAVMLFCVPAASAKSSGLSQKPSITASPNSVLIGDVVTVRGSGFKPKAKLVFKINETKYAVGVTNRKGRLKLSFTVPAGSWQELSLKVTAGNRSASAVVYVVDGEINFDNSNGVSDPNGDLMGEEPGDPDNPDYEPEFVF